MKKTLSNHLISKYYLIILAEWIFVILFIFIHYMRNEIYIERYPGLFLGYIELILNGRIELNFNNIIGLFYHNEFNNQLSGYTLNLLNTESYFNGFTSLFLILKHLTGLDSLHLLITPLGVILIPLGYGIVLKNFIKNYNNDNKIIFSLSFTYFLFFFIETKIYGSFYIAPVTYFITLIIFLNIKKYLENVHLNTRALFIILFNTLIITFYWHTANLIISVFILCIFLVSYSIYLLNALNNNRIKLGFNINKIYSLLVCDLLITIIFSNLWQSNYLISYYNTANIIEYIQLLVKRFIGQIPFETNYLWNYKDFFLGKIYFYSLILIYLFSSLLLLVAFKYCIYEYNTNKTINFKSILPIVLVLSEIILSILYYKTHSINFLYVPYYFPLFSVYIFTNQIKQYKKNNKLFIFLLVAICFFSCITALSSYYSRENGQTSYVKYNDTETCFNYFKTYSLENTTVYVDFNIVGKFITREAKISQLKFDYAHINPSIYEMSINKKIVPKIAQQYIIIDYYSMKNNSPIHTISNRGLLIPKLNEINNSSNKNKIFSDKWLNIFIFL